MQSGASELYLDLLEKCLVNTIYEDPACDPWHKGFATSARHEGQDWPSVAHSMIGARRMHSLRTLCEDVLRRDVPGDFIETGVWRGGACIMMRGVLKAHDVRDRIVWVADSFEGLPPPSDQYIADRNDAHHTYRELAVSQDQVRKNFERYNLHDSQVRFLKGWFRDTLPSAPIERLAIARLDGDMYESTYDALTALYQRVSPGGYIIIDDYGAIAACALAVTNFRASRNIEAPLQTIDASGVYWQVP